MGAAAQAGCDRAGCDCDFIRNVDAKCPDDFPAGFLVFNQFRRADAVDVGHEAKIGRISEEAIFYLMSRGMTEEDARALIVGGFAEPIAKELPLEYAVEMNNLIHLEMKGSIG